MVIRKGKPKWQDVDLLKAAGKLIAVLLVAAILAAELLAAVLEALFEGPKRFGW